MPHIEEEQLSAYIDRQLATDESREVDQHLQECESCRAVLGEMQDLTGLFQDAERFEPSPFLWNRIAANVNDGSYRQSLSHGWRAAIRAGLRRYAWNSGLAAATLGILMFAGIAVFRQNSGGLSEKDALAQIDRAYLSLAAQDPDTYNPFSSGSQPDFDANPFKNVRLSGRSDSVR